jgi:hypothetical protein
VVAQLWTLFSCDDLARKTQNIASRGADQGD